MNKDRKLEQPRKLVQTFYLSFHSLYRWCSDIEQFSILWSRHLIWQNEFRVIDTTDTQNAYSYLNHHIESKTEGTKTILFCKKNLKKRKKNTLILPITYLKRITFTLSRFWLTTYLPCLVGIFFQKRVGIPIRTNCVPFTATCSFIRTRQNSYRGFSGNRREASNHGIHLEMTLRI